MAGTKNIVSQRKTGKHVHREEVGLIKRGEEVTAARRESWAERAKALQEGRNKIREAAGSEKGLATPSIVVHAEKIASFAAADALGKRVDNADEVARLAKDYFADNNLSYHLVFVKGGKVVGFRLYPNAASYKNGIDKLTFTDVDFSSLRQSVAKIQASGYYVIENTPTKNISDAATNIEEHVRIASEIPGYLGGVVMGLADEYGELSLKASNGIKMSKKRGDVDFRKKRISDPQPEVLNEYGVLYTILNEHQDLIDTPATTPKDIEKVSRVVARAEKSVLLVFRRLNKTVAVQEIPQSLYMKSKTFNDYVEDQARKYAASGITAVVNSTKAEAAIKTFRRTVNKTDLDMTLAAEGRDGTISIIESK